MAKETSGTPKSPKVVVREVKGKTYRSIPIETIPLTDTRSLRIEVSEVENRVGLSLRVWKDKAADWETKKEEESGKAPYIGPTGDGFFIPADSVSEFLVTIMGNVKTIEEGVEFLSSEKR